MKKIASFFGFHLFELLIGISIISIFIAMGVPIYTNYFVKENRLEAASMLGKLSVALEKYYFVNNGYQKATLKNLQFPSQIVRGNYQLQIQNAAPDFYLIAAIPLKKQAKNDTRCGALLLDSLGEQKITGTGKVGDCW